MTITRRHGRLLGAAAAASVLGWAALSADATAHAGQVATTAATVSPARPITVAAETDVRSEILRLTNVERAKAGLKPLTADPCLAPSAQAWSQRMAAEKRLYHSDLSSWMRSCALTRAAENVAMGGQTAAQTVNMWMNSPGHRRNILDPNLTKLGVGWVDNGSWATQQFGA